MNKNYLYFI